ncbi:DUF1330 domain-containing protein [Pseudoalteromonas luteoviolacea]|uniref:DUF1330 domain-containing protein n=1 Tax=Pseudoalteromonas luteoviolacea H33 TaxID=1365251 RepID=A0A167GGL4_9GAMM|nr:DUF1330 domain-containing protein [Pseudoalteromonas luteoviolacea]KZN55270.1 hypothetical protein N476_26355 [Pseudoalteromonas luteoviolacea H33]KZN73567.1 hypothetical protein N477_23335 [Pseudoalteromonas luteoviolacea H33-S]MBQ4880585.1 DUF1330 domain-containing protein [Pseudoalteromonas luteoviolacea]MBQ4909627.1 DUF1330 domain-containing protein [Pseudoalteromonas luteoviolacea]
MAKYEMLVGLEVLDDVVYSQYRTAMRPILEEKGGEFGYDFRVSEVLKSEVTECINRVFTLRFPSKSIMTSFFDDPRYQAVKSEYFSPSVGSFTIIRGYDVDECHF